MIRKLLDLLADYFVHWRIGLMVAVVVAAMLALGLSLRPRYIAEAMIDVGGVSFIDGNRIIKFSPFESDSKVEAFFSHYVAIISNDFYARCNVAAVYSPDGQRLKMTCKGKSESQVRELTASALQPLLVRHALYYEKAKAINEKNYKLIDHEIRGTQQMIAALRKPPISSLSEALIIQHQMKIKSLLDQVEINRMLGNQVRQTQIESKGITVLDRKPGFGVWAAVAGLALFASLVVMVFFASLKRLEQQVHQPDA